MSTRDVLIKDLAAELNKIALNHPLRVGIDGFCAAGKTTLAAEIGKNLQAMGRTILSVTTDDFQVPEDRRWVRGKMSPEGFRLDSTDFEQLKILLLLPLGPKGNRQVQPASHSFREPDKAKMPPSTWASDTILILDGLFLFDPRLDGCLDFRIFVDANFSICLERAIQRNQEQKKSPRDLIELYQRRYIPGYKSYLEITTPKKHADVVLDNDLPETIRRVLP